MECDELTEPRNIPEDFDDDGLGDDFDDDDDIADKPRSPEEHRLSCGKPHDSSNAQGPRSIVIHLETINARDP